MDFVTFLPDWPASKYWQTDPGKSTKNVGFQEKHTCPKESFSQVGFLRGRFWFAFWSNVISTIWLTENDYEFREPVGPEACRRTAPQYAHRRHGQTVLFYDIDRKKESNQEVFKRLFHVHSENQKNRTTKIKFFTERRETVLGFFGRVYFSLLCGFSFDFRRVHWTIAFR